MRWDHPVRGNVPPGEFIPIAEETGLVVPLGARVLRAACEQVARWQRETGYDGLRLTVNVSARQMAAPDFVAPHLPRLRAFAERIRQEGISDVVLMGMGGSSLAPEVLRRVVGVAPGWPRFRVLDSVDPDAVRDAMANAATSLFVLASKSGSTIEPNTMAAEAQRRVRAAGIPYRSTPGGSVDMQINTRLVGRNFYWNDSDGHNWEVLTVSYARSQPAAAGLASS